MKFTEHRDSHILTVKQYSPGVVRINALEITKSCFLNQKNLIENWLCDDIKHISTELIDQMLTLNPDVIILGTGEQQAFPSAKFFAYCAEKGIGLEVMDNSAACRTYNVLTTEEREVVLALIMSPLHD